MYKPDCNSTFQIQTNISLVNRKCITLLYDTYPHAAKITLLKFGFVVDRYFIVPWLFICTLIDRLVFIQASRPLL